MRSYAYAVAFIIIALVAAHFAAISPYLWYQNSISQLGAQSYERAWIMRLGFIGFGILVLLTGADRIRKQTRTWFRELPIMVYGLGILLSGFFSAEPFIQGAYYSQMQADIHGVLASIAGFALSAAILLFALTDTPNSRKVGHVVALVLVTGFSLLFGMSPSVAGAMQRLLWVAGFGWLLFLGPVRYAQRDGQPERSSA